MKLIATFAFSAAILAAQSAQLHSVTAVRHWSLSDTTRIAIEVTGDFEYRTDRLHNPERVYYDILDARPRIGSRRGYTRDLRDKLATRVRVAETLPGVTRIVLDLTDSSIEATASKLSNPDRLIVELRRQTAPPVTPATGAPVTVTETPVTVPAPAAAKSPIAEPAPPPPKVVEVAAKPEPELPKKPEAPLVAAETGRAAHHTSDGRTSLVRALGLKLGRVVIDPGHGGHDQGTEGRHGLLEKDLVLDVSQRVGKLIEERLGAEVVYTRSDDTFIPLEQRTAFAMDKKADLFLSIHANSSPVPRIAGFETYYLNFTSARDALDVAARENAASEKSIAELQDIVNKITLHDKAEESRDFASRIQESMYKFSTRYFPGVRDRGVKKAPFVVLIGAKIPSVLVEIGFLSNTREETLLRRSDYRQKLAEALYQGVARYAESLSHFQVAKATDRK